MNTRFHALTSCVYPLAIGGFLLAAAPLNAQQPLDTAPTAQQPAIAPAPQPPAPQMQQPGAPDGAVSPDLAPDATTGLAPQEHPLNNANPDLAGRVPSSQRTAAHNETISEHDREPIMAHTFNFTDDQRQALVAALASETAGEAQRLNAGEPLTESMVIPADTEVKELPAGITADMPWVQRYGYVRDGDRILLIDPHLRYVAAVIETSTSAR